MCARFTLKSGPEALLEAFAQLDLDEAWLGELPPPRYNIAPTQPIAMVTRASNTTLGTAAAHEPAHRLQLATWGLVPHWSRPTSKTRGLVNARSETVASKPSFRDAFRARRCLILADGFYEWRRHGGGVTPMYIEVNGGAPFAMAGLWEPAQLDGAGTPRRPARPTCTLLTTIPNRLMQPIHNRMPVILPASTWETWLSPSALSAAEQSALLVPHPAEAMRAVEVSPRVNAVRNDDPRCVLPALRLL